MRIMQPVFDAFIFNANLDVLSVCKHFELLGFALIPHAATLGYRYAYLLELGGSNHGLIQYGGDNVGTGVYVSVAGSHAGRVRDSVQSWDAKLLRADIALDFNGSQFFSSITLDLVNLAKSKNLKTSTVGDWAQRIGGRTLYIGSRQSTYMVRLYEKYKQKGVDCGDFETIRLELEIKPALHARLAAFTMTPFDLLSSAKTYASIYEKYLSLTNAESLTRPRTMTSHEKAFAQMIKQYQKTIKKQLDITGGCLDTFYRSLINHPNWINENE